MDGLRRNRKVLILTLLLAGGVSIARPAQLGAEAGEETESQLMRAITRETEVWKKLRLLDQWKEEYPSSSHKEQRIRDYMMAYFGAKQWAKAFGAAQDLIKLRPEDLTAHEFIILLTPYIGANNRQIQDAGEMSAAIILNAGVGKPKAVGEAEWEQRKKLLDEEARVVLGWIAMQRGDYKAATSHFVNVLRMDPGNAHASLWLGKNLFSQGNPYGYGIGLFSLARAAVYEGEGALSPIERKDADTLLTNTCRKYFWTTKGLDSVKESAQLQPIPPPRFLPLAMALPKELLLDAAKFSSILFLAWAALFGACFVTYKRNMAERITSLLFHTSAFCSFLSLYLIVSNVDLVIRGDQILQATAPGFLHGYEIFVGGWSRFNLDLAIAVAPSALIMWRLGEWIDFDDSDFYEGILVIAVFVGVVYAVGISLLLKTAGTILGIVATVVGIAVGVKRLWAKTSG